MATFPSWAVSLARDVADLVCLLSVPVNKTSPAFTKPVGKVIAEYVRTWEAIRGQQPTVVDRKTRQPTHYLFMHRGRKLGRKLLNGVLIPLLCRKAGVPLEDLPGKRITSHRGRASLATWYYNTREGMSLEELQRWLGHAEIRSTEQYVRPSPIRLAKKFARAHANSYVMDVLVDADAVTSGAAAKGAAWQYYPLGNGDFCTNPFYATCPHRMACARCEFHLPAESQVATALLAKEGLQHMLVEMPLDEEERAAVEGGLEAMDNLINKRRHVPTPDGRTPEEISSQPATSSFIPLSELAS